MKIIRRALQRTFVASIIVFSNCAIHAFAATVNIAVGTNAVGNAADVFIPATATIAVNDRVIWTWAGNGHSTTSGTISNITELPDGLWSSGVHNASPPPPFSFTNTFVTAGSFPYYCSVHGVTAGMKGTIIVAAAAPTISITNPINGATFSAPASFTLVATVSDSNGNVTNVEFFQDGISLGNIAATPFSIQVNDLAAADYTFSAVSSDDAGLTATNAITIHVVAPNPIVISAPVFSPPSDFQFSYTANIGLSYAIQQSVNLSNWTSISTNLAAASLVPFDDTNATGNPGFYRVELLPNP